MDCLIPEEMRLGALARRYLSAMLRTEGDHARLLVQHALDAGTPLASLYLDVLAATQEAIGRLWQLGHLSVAQEHYCTAVSQGVMAMLSRRAFDAPRNGRIMVAACVEGNLHEFGLRMVADFFEMAGWRTVYLGAELPSHRVPEAVASSGAQVVALSASMDSHLPAIAHAIGTLRGDERTRGVTILAGGGAFNADAQRWRAVGADGFALDAPAAVQLASGLLAGSAR